MTSTSTRAMTTTPAAVPEPTHVLILQGIKKHLAAIQAHLEFASFQRLKNIHNNHTINSEDDDQEEEREEFEYPQFATKQGLGRVALLASILGIVWGIHFAGALQLTFHHAALLFSSTRQQQQQQHDNGDNDDDHNDNHDDVLLLFMDTRRLLYFFAWQWCIYVLTVCTFHFMEFFITAIYNPTTCSADSFLINHSTSYTAAAISSWMEFFSTRIFLLVLIKIIIHGKVITMPRIVQYGVHRWIQWSHWSFGLGIVIVMTGQVIRSWAMMTAGESFNHLIQTRRKANHVLITHGIYAYLRHPSYVGFYYWSIGEQFILSNAFNVIILAIVACIFFQRRIPYEEESLIMLFPNEYPAYIQRTWMGIPFIPKTHLVIVETAVATNTDTTNNATGEKED